MPLRRGLAAVAAREVRWILGDPVARFLLFGVPIIAFVALGFTFSSAVVRGLDVVAVDMDNSAASRLFIQTIAAAPGVTIAERGNDLGAAASAIRAGRAIAAIYLPPEFAKDLLSGRAPRPVVFTNSQFFTPGNNAGKSLRDAVTSASTAVAPARQATRDRTAVGPGLVPEEYVLSNPALNYAQFLLRAVLPTVLHVVIAISAGYAVGSEFRRRSMRAWWELSGRSIATALVGKLLPYYVVLMLMFVLMVGILDVWLGVSFRGSAVLTAVSATLLIVAYQMIGCLMQLLVRNMAVGLSLTGIIVSPAFGFAGVGFPVLAMQDFPRAWGAILPLRWYIQILFDQATRGAAVQFTAQPFAFLCGITLVLALLVWLRFRALVRRGLTVPEEVEPQLRPATPGVVGAFVAEWRRTLGDRAVFSLFMLAPVLYAFFYPQPYLGQIVRKIPIAIVDQDHSELGRALIQALEAHDNISVALRASSYREAEDAILARHAFAILGIPPDTEKNVLKGTAARLPVYADSTYFILFNRSLQGILESVQAFAADLLTHGARPEGAGVQAASRLASTGGTRAGAAVQPDRLVCELRRAGGFRADPASDAADGGGDAGWRRLRARRPGEPAGAGIGHGNPRAGAGTLDAVRAGDAPLLRGDAAGVRLLDTRVGRGARGPVAALHPGDEFPGAGAGPGVPPPRDRRSAGAGEQPATVLPGRRVLAGRGTSGTAAASARTAAQCQRDRRHRPHQPDGREPCRGATGLAAPLGPHAALFRRCDGHRAAAHGSEAE